MTKQSQIATKVSRQGTAIWDDLFATVLIAAHKTGEARYTEKDWSEAERENARKKREDEDDNFSNRAFTHAPADLKRVGVTGSIVSDNARTGAELIRALEIASRKHYIKNLVVYCHAGGYGIIMKEDIGFTHNKHDVFQNSADVMIRKRDQGITDMKLWEMGLRDVEDLVKAVKRGEVSFVENPTIVIVGCFACGVGSCRGDALVPTLAKELKANVIGSFSGADQSGLTESQQASGKWEFASKGWWLLSGANDNERRLTAKELGSEDFRIMRTAKVLR